MKKHNSSKIIIYNWLSTTVQRNRKYIREEPKNKLFSKNTVLVQHLITKNIRENHVHSSPDHKPKISRQ